jgi:hypothetical protein
MSNDLAQEAKKDLLRLLCERLWPLAVALIGGYASYVISAMAEFVQHYPQCAQILLGIMAGISILSVIVAARFYRRYGGFREAYGVFWDRTFNLRCLACKRPLKFSSYDASVFHCSDRKCDSKHTLRTNDGKKLTKQEAIDLIRAS